MYTRSLTTLALLPLLASWLVACSSNVETGPDAGTEPDPIVLDIPLAYIDRPLPVDDNGNPVPEDILAAQTFMPGARLYLKDRAASTAAQIDIGALAFGEDALYDVKDLSASYDGERLVFAMRAPDIEGADEEDQPKWNIWEYDIPSASLRRVIADDIQAEVGHDVAPRYLPGVERRIVFASTRQSRSRAILLDDGKPQYAALDDSRDEEAFVLHAMDNDGTNVEQLSYNQSHDLAPLVLNDGRVLYSRWDRMSGNNQISFYAMDPYGMRQTLEYGYHSQDTGTNGSEATFVRPGLLPDGRVYGVLRSRQSQRYGGDLVALDREGFISATQPVDGGTPGAGQASFYPLPLTTDDSLAAAGSFYSVQPLYDNSNRYIASWSRCRIINADNNLPANCTDEALADPATVPADPLYGIYLYDAANETLQPVLLPVEGHMLVEPTLLMPREQDALISPPVAGVDFDQELADQGLGSLYIESVYDFDGVDLQGIEATRDPANPAFGQRPARFLRLVKAVSIPSDEVLDFPNTAFGRSAANGMREILGYVPIEPDGSVMTKVPADVAFTFDVLDANGRRLNGFPRHNNWLQLRAGEQRQCVGCHTRASELPHGRADAQPESANNGAPTDGVFTPSTNPLLPARYGDTMAETYSRVKQAIRTPSVDILYTDEWTNTTVLPPDADIALLAPSISLTSPVDTRCVPWSAGCRITIHYPDHIQPIWDLARPDPVDPMIDSPCSSCHSPADAMGALQVPAGQLDLRAEPSPDQQDHFIGYRELLFNDVEQEIVGGALVDRLVQAEDANGNLLWVIELDADGNPVLDANGDPVYARDANGDLIPVLVTVPVQAAMSANGALPSNRFFTTFSQAGATVDHRGLLSDAELKLISEWLDLGAQYYNNPFAVPVN